MIIKIKLQISIFSFNLQQIFYIKIYFIKSAKRMIFYFYLNIFKIFKILCLLYIVRGHKYMSRLARVFRIDEISHQPGGRISWWTLVQIIFKNLANDLKNMERNIQKEIWNICPYSRRNSLMRKLRNSLLQKYHGPPWWK
jgi:hypothetical protein